LNPAFLPPDADESTVPPSKDRALASLTQHNGEQPFDSVWAVGNAEDDLEMLRRADRAFLIGPQAEALKLQLERAIILTHTEDLLAEIDEQALAA
jgi:phosphoserine phosphatase